MISIIQPEDEHDGLCTSADSWLLDTRVVVGSLSEFVLVGSSFVEYKYTASELYAVVIGSIRSQKRENKHDLTQKHFVSVMLSHTNSSDMIVPR